jgi:uncharacterized protein YecE (DUF72 family)
VSDSDKLAAILIQLPQSFKIDSKQSLENFFKLLPDDFAFAVEFRDRSWQQKEAYDLLEQYNVSCVITDSPLELEMQLTTDWAYVRYHGRGDKVWFDYRYSQDEIENLAKKLEKIKNETSIVYGYFNNHYGGEAVENALQMIRVMENLSSKQLELLNRFNSKTTGLPFFT